MALIEKILLIILGIEFIATFVSGFFSKNENTDMDYLDEC